MGKNNKIDIKYKCLGSASQVTGSHHLITIYVDDKEFNIVVDYGMVQDSTKNIRELYKTNSRETVDWKNVDFVILSHNHADHVALMPLAVMRGYQGYFYCTAPAIEFSDLILSDSAHIQSVDCKRINETKEGKKNPLYPLYTPRHVHDVIERFRGYDYNKEIKLNDYITLELKPTGHILSACSPYITVKHGEDVKRILFTGDTSANKVLPFTKSANMKDLKVDYIVSEGTYGDKKQVNNNVKQKLKKYMFETCIRDRAQLVIPVFAVGRSTSTLSYLHELCEENPEFKKIPIYLASPMAYKSHNIYGNNDSFNFYDKKWHKFKNMWKDQKVEYITRYKDVEEQLFNKKPKIILCASGMIAGGYSVSIVAGILSNAKNTLLFCGYQGMGTIGRTILNSKLGEKIRIDNKKIDRRCNIDFMNMSSHADYTKIIEMFKQMRHTKIKKIFLSHGDDEVLNTFKSHLDKEFNSEVVVSRYDKIYTLT